MACPSCGAAASVGGKAGSSGLIFKVELTEEEIYRRLKSEREVEKK
jgi:hypothetical protein